MQHTDQRYIDALLNNNVFLTKEIYEKYTGKIKALILLNHGSMEDAKDVFQEALVAIFNIARNQAFTLTCPFDAFLYMVCRRIWLKKLKKRSTAGVTINDTEVYKIGEDNILQAELCYLQKKRLELIHKKLSELGETCRQLLQLVWRLKSMEEVAKALNVTYGYARKKKCECMAKLIKLVKQDPDYPDLKW